MIWMDRIELDQLQNNSTDHDCKTHVVVRPFPGNNSTRTHLNATHSTGAFCNPPTPCLLLWTFWKDLDHFLTVSRTHTIRETHSLRRETGHFGGRPKTPMRRRRPSYLNRMLRRCLSRYARKENDKSNRLHEANTFLSRAAAAKCGNSNKSYDRPAGRPPSRVPSCDS